MKLWDRDESNPSVLGTPATVKQEEKQITCY